VKAIWKFPLPVSPVVYLSMPENAKILTVQTQGEGACIWALVDIHNIPQRRCFVILPTGHEFDGAHALGYVGTFQVPPHVWHVFERAW
jgi:hypothetical protein